MLAPSFINVGGAQTFKLSDLKVTGYDPEDGAWGEFALTTLTTSGRNDKAYYWNDNEEAPAGWYDFSGETMYDADKIVFDAGQAFWVQGEGLTLQCAGQVNVETVSFVTPSLGKVAIGNPFPVALTLADVYVTGYDPEDGAWGEFALTTLTTSGRNDQAYYWNDNEEAPAGWYDFSGETPYEADKIPVPVGQGYWVQGEGFTLNFNKLSL